MRDAQPNIKHPKPETQTENPPQNITFPMKLSTHYEQILSSPHFCQWGHFVEGKEDPDYHGGTHRTLCVQVIQRIRVNCTLQFGPANEVHQNYDMEPIEAEMGGALGS